MPYSGVSPFICSSFRFSSLHTLSSVIADIGLLIFPYFFMGVSLKGKKKFVSGCWRVAVASWSTFGSWESLSMLSLSYCMCCVHVSRVLCAIRQFNL